MSEPFKVTIIEDELNERIEVWIGDREVTNANHNEDGWSGMNKIQYLFERLQEMGICTVEHKDKEHDE